MNSVSDLLKFSQNYGGSYHFSCGYYGHNQVTKACFAVGVSSNSSLMRFWLFSNNFFSQILTKSSKEIVTFVVLAK